MTEGLKPCPFCGSESEVRMMTLHSGEKLYGVFCKEDLAAEIQHGHFIDNFATKSEAIESWNRRANDEQ